MGDLELVFDGAIARIRFNAPARRNALNRASWRALPEACTAIEARAEALVVIVDGAGAIVKLPVAVPVIQLKLTVAVTVCGPALVGGVVAPPSYVNCGVTPAGTTVAVAGLGVPS